MIALLDVSALDGIETNIRGADSAIRIACLGDSITAGARVDARTESYPAKLRLRLGSGWDVENFGIGGATLIKVGRPNVWSVLDRVKNYQPDAVVISLGTNDTVGKNRKNWDRIDRFDNDYRDLITQLRGLGSSPIIFVCVPTPMVLETEGLTAERIADLREREPRLRNLSDRIRRVVAEFDDLGVVLVDLNGLLNNRPDLMTFKDGVHPNVKGYEQIAREVCKILLLNKRLKARRASLDQTCR
ncbi:GDSL-type esterase/lipase family protein [bacterium]|nr:GDSL-type esterase/lipase family protein [Rhodopirellula sp.]MDB4679038.1 GDSL-type esterase/lipase family protein [Rhodopirellula sp.]MDC0279001.1 GDSL-type esterase/lipase family protein [bacterium]